MLSLQNAICLLVLIVYTLSVAVCYAEEPAKKAPESEQNVSGYLEVDYNSRYVFRGVAYSKGPVLQPSVLLTINEFSFYSYSNYVLDKEPQQGKINEVDLYLTWSHKWQGVLIEPSFDIYTQPNVPDSHKTLEPSLALSYNIGNFKLSTDQSVDFDHKPSVSYYGDAGLQHSLQILQDLSLKSSFVFAWPKPKISLDVAIVQNLTKNIYLSFHTGMSMAIEGGISDTLNHNLVVYGFGAGTKF